MPPPHRDEETIDQIAAALKDDTGTGNGALAARMGLTTGTMSRLLLQAG